jgi:phosphatidate cytidylyltransferase
MNAPSPTGFATRTGAFASRAVVAAIVVAAFVGLAWADAVGLGGSLPAWWLLPVVVVVAARGAAEYAGLFAAAGVGVRGPIVQFATVMVAVSAAVGAQAFAADAIPVSPVAALGWTAVAVTLAVVLLAAAELPGYRAGARRLEPLAAGVFVVASLGLPLAFMVALRLVCVEDLGPEQRGPGHLGILPLVSLVAVVKAGDIAAYVVGTLVGRHRMAPLLSPGKTWEGAAASLVASLAAAWFVLERTGFSAVQPWGGWPVFGLLVGGAGMVGDLAESFVKRELGAKDSGRLLGGLGGVMDLVDSLLLAAPIAWILWVLGR